MKATEKCSFCWFLLCHTLFSLGAGAGFKIISQSFKEIWDNLWSWCFIIKSWPVYIVIFFNVNGYNIVGQTPEATYSFFFFFVFLMKGGFVVILLMWLSHTSKSYELRGSFVKLSVSNVVLLFVVFPRYFSLFDKIDTILAVPCINTSANKMNTRFNPSFPMS